LLHLRFENDLPGSAAAMSASPHFRDRQAAAIHRLAALGFSDYGIAQTMRIAVEEVRKVLAGPPLATVHDIGAARNKRSPTKPSASDSPV